MLSQWYLSPYQWITTIYVFREKHVSLFLFSVFREIQSFASLITIWAFEVRTQEQFDTVLIRFLFSYSSCFCDFCATQECHLISWESGERKVRDEGMLYICLKMFNICLKIFTCRSYQTRVDYHHLHRCWSYPTKYFLKKNVFN